MGKFRIDSAPNASVASELRTVAAFEEDGWTNAPADLLLRAADIIDGRPPVVDGTGWAEAAFVDDVDPASREESHEEALRRCKYVQCGDGIGLTSMAHPGWPEPRCIYGNEDCPIC